MSTITLLLLSCLATAPQAEVEIPPDVFVKSLDKWHPHSGTLTPDKRWLIVRDYSQPQDVDRLISLTDPNSRTTLPLRYVTLVSPNGRWLVGSTEDGHALFELAHASVPRLTARLGESAGPYFKFSEDSRYLIQLAKDNTETSWLLETATGEVQQTVMPDFYFVSDKWRVESSGNQALRFVERDNPSREMQMEIAANSRLVIAGTTAKALIGYPGPQFPWQLKPRDWLLIVAPTQAILVDVQADDPVSSSRVIHQPLGEVEFARVAPDASWLVVPQEQAVVFVDVVKNELTRLEAKGGLTLDTRFNYYNYDETAFERSPDGWRLLYTGYCHTANGMIGEQFFAARVWNLFPNAGVPFISITRETMMHETGAKWELIFSEDSQSLVGVPEHGNAILWELGFDRFTLSEFSQIHQDKQIAVSDDRQVIVWSDNTLGNTFMWRADVAKMKPKAVHLCDPGLKLTSLKFIPGTQVLLVVVDGRMMTWDMSGQEPCQTMDEPIWAKGSVGSVLRYGDNVVVRCQSSIQWWQFGARHPDVTSVESRELCGPFVAELNGTQLFLWDVRQIHQRWVLQQSGVKWVRFQGDGDWLWAGNKGDDLLMWDLRKLLPASSNRLPH